MKQIAFVNTKSCVWGGVERYIQSTVPLINELGFSITGVFEEKPEYQDDFQKLFTEVLYADDINNLISRLKASAVEIIVVHKILSAPLLSALKDNFKIIFVIHDHDYYCIRRHKYFPVTRKNCPLPNNPVYCALCSGMVNKVFGKIRPINIFAKQKMLNLVRSSDRFIVLSEYMKQNLLMNNFKPEDISIVHPYKDIEPSPIVPPPRRGKLLFAGQLIRGKGFDLLLESLSRVRSEFTLDVIGKGDDENRINGALELLGLKNKITFHGWVNDTSRFFNNADIVLFPSRWQEPFGLVGIEAYSYGRPVIAFDVGGVTEWLKDGKNGFVIPPFDTEKMAEKIDLLIQNHDLSAEMGAFGRADLEVRFSGKNFMNAFNRLMESLNV